MGQWAYVDAERRLGARERERERGAANSFCVIIYVPLSAVTIARLQLVFKCRVESLPLARGCQRSVTRRVSGSGAAAAAAATATVSHHKLTITNQLLVTTMRQEAAQHFSHCLRIEAVAAVAAGVAAAAGVDVRCSPFAVAQSMRFP